ncbi:MAG: hypothetical protein K2Q10_14645 [Rhodospirillales bacterium]|nr:hypothetical protein [Rhodospirillales bacterium]
MMKFLAMTVAALSLLAAVPAHAAGSWVFEVTNKSSASVKSFSTKENGEWSGNWIRGDKIAPGDTFELDFGSSKGDCEVRTKIVFTDGSYFDYDVDYCKSNKIFLYDDKLVTK